MKVLIIGVAIVVTLFLIVVGLFFFCFKKTTKSVATNVKQPPDNSYILKDLDLSSGDLALVIIDKKRKFHFIQDNQLIRDHQGSLRMSLSLFSFLPGNISQKSGIYVFKNKRLIFKREFRLLKDFEPGTLLKDSKTVDSHYEYGLPSEIIALKAKLEKLENVYIYNNDLEGIEEKHPNKDFMLRVSGKAFAIPRDQEATFSEAINREFKERLSDHINDSVLKTSFNASFTSFNSALFRLFRDYDQSNPDQFILYKPVLEIYGDQKDLQLSKEQIDELEALLNSMEDSVFATMMATIELNRLDDRQKDILNDFRSQFARVDMPRKRLVSISYFKERSN